MTTAQRFIATVIVLVALACMVIPGVILFSMGEIALLSTWSAGCILILLYVLWRSVYTMKPSTMIMKSCLGNAYDLYSPVLKDAPSETCYGNGILESGLVVAFPPNMVQVVKWPAGLIEVAFLSNGATVQFGKKGKYRPGTTVYIHGQFLLKKNIASMAKLFHLLFGLAPHYNFTHIIRGTFFESRENSSQIPETKTKDCPCLVEYLQQLLQSPLDEAVTFALSAFTLDQARSSIHEIEVKIFERLNEPGTVFSDHKLSEVFEVFDLNVLAVVLADENAQKALFSGTTELLNAAGVEEKARGVAHAITIEGNALTKRPGAEMAARIRVATELAKNQGAVIIGQNPLTMAESVIVANRVTNNNLSNLPQSAEQKNPSRKEDE